MKKRILGIVMAVMLGLTCFSTLIGCVGDKNDPNTISIATWVTDPTERLKNQQIFDEFTAETGIQVKMVPMGIDTSSTDLIRMQAGGNMPDLVWLSQFHFPVLAEKGMLCDLKPFIEKDADIKTGDYYAPAIAMGKYKDVTYGLPRDIGTTVMAFNKDIIMQDDIPDLNSYWTWDEMTALGRKYMRSENGVYNKFGLGNVKIEKVMPLFGTYFYSQDGKTSLLNTDKTIEAIDAWLAMQGADSDRKIAPSSAELAAGVGNNPFIGNKAAFNPCAPWDFNYYRNANIRFDIRPMPLGDPEGNVFATGLSIAISQVSRKKDNAFKLLKYLTWDYGLELMSAKGLGFPSRISVSKSQSYLGSGYIPESFDFFYDVLQNAVVQPTFLNIVPANAIVADYMNQCLTNNWTFRSKADEVHKKVQSALDAE